MKANVKFKMMVTTLLTLSCVAHAESHKYSCVFIIQGKDQPSPDLTITHYGNSQVIQAQRDGFESYNLHKDKRFANVYREPAAEEGDTPETMVFIDDDTLDTYKGDLKLSHCLKIY